MGNKYAKKLAEYTGWSKRQVRVLFLGLDAAGKTTMLYRMKLGEVVTTIPTIGFNVETVTYKKFDLNVWDVGGRDKMRPLFRHYFANTDALVWVLDSNDRDRVGDSREELHRFLKEDELRDSHLLVLANKQDLPSAMSVDEIREKLELETLRNRRVQIIPTVATTGEGIYEALEWITDALLNKPTTETQQVQTNKQSVSSALMNPINETIKDVMNIGNNIAKSDKENAATQTWAEFFSKFSSYVFFK